MQSEPRYRTLVDVFDQSLSRFGGRDLFGTKTEAGWRWTTYAEFGALVAKCRAGLAGIGIGRGDRVAVISDNRVEWAVAAYACYTLGAAYVPMYEAQNPKEWEFVVRDCEANALLVANDRVLESALDLVGSVPSLRSIILVDASAGAAAGAKVRDGRITTYAKLLAAEGAVPAVQPDPGDMAALIYTSGTTGNPKGVILSHANLASNVSAIHEILPLDQNDRSLSFLPWAHSFGQTAELHILFSTGASMALCESVDKILVDLVDVKPSVLLSVPRIFNKLYMAVQQQVSSKPRVVQDLVKIALSITAKKKRGERLRLREIALLAIADRLVFSKARARLGGRLRFAVSGGAALSPNVAEFIDAMGITVLEGYGLSETSPVVAVNVPGASKVGSVGRPLPGVRVEIDPSAVEPREGGGGSPSGRREGEIVVHGPNVMQGYLKRPEETAAVLTSDGALRTGDMGYLDPEGFLFITGRIKEQYKLENGKYVVPTPLEEQLKLSPYIANAMIYGDNKPYNVALLVANVPALEKWAAKNHVTLPAQPDAILGDRQVLGLFEGEVRKYSASFKGFESIRDFALIASDFTTDNGMLTPSLKLKRRKVLEMYMERIEQLYAKGNKGKARSGAAA